MGKKIGLIALVVFLLLIFGFGYLYFFFGLEDFLRAKREISQLSPEASIAAEEWLYRRDTQNAYSGILARANKDVIWIWGARGLKRYRAGEGPAYSLFVGCDKASSDVGDRKQYIIEKKVVGEMEEWMMKIKRGDYVEVLFPPGDARHRNFREVNGYDWWIFLPKTMEEQCAR